MSKKGNGILICCTCMPKGDRCIILVVSLRKSLGVRILLYVVLGFIGNFT